MINLIFGYLLLIILLPFWLLSGVMFLFSHPDDNKDRHPWNIIPLRLGVQGILLPLLIIVVPLMCLTFPIWYYGGELAEEAFGKHKPLFIGKYWQEP